VRQGVERAYRCGALRVLCATSTLSQGVNLPTKTVLVCGTARKGVPVSIREFLNTAGRAGRPFRESEGHVILIAAEEEEAAELRARYLDDPRLEPVESHLVQLYRDLVAARIDLEAPNLTDPLLELDPGEPGVHDAALQTLDLQLLAALMEEVVDTDDEELVITATRKVLGDTLGAVQLGAETITAGPLQQVAAHRIRAVVARIPDPQLRAAFLRTGLSLRGNEDALDAARAVHAAIAEDPTLLEHHQKYQLVEMAAARACTIREVHRAATDSRIAVGAVPALACDWIGGLAIDQLRDRHAAELGVSDPMRFAAILDRLMTKELAWALSALLHLLEHACGQPLNPVLEALPAMVKYGVDTPAACFAAALGVRNREDAIGLGEVCPAEAESSFQAFLYWLGTTAPWTTYGFSPETLARLTGHATTLTAPRTLLAFAAGRSTSVSVPLVPAQASSGDLTSALRNGAPLRLRREHGHSDSPDTIAVTSESTRALGYLDPAYARVLAPLMDNDALLETATYLEPPTYGPRLLDHRPRVLVRAEQPDIARLVR